ncbi:MAG: pknB 20 [Prosthecobacter sp.]|nr:pknB 20 [Prosthecobacter sp.]
MSDDPSVPQPTPTNYQRTTGGSHLRWQPPTAERLQEMLPAYEILSILGQGGMGAVYKGRQKSLDRIVAIKILPPEAGEDDMQFVERFKNEARTMAKMNHPAIVHVYDFGETTEGQLYIVMEYIDGTDVAKMIQSQGKLPEDYALSITAHVCDALGYAHTHGVVHRDIKPANILINMEGQVKVADFGLAKATDPKELGLTKTNMAMGTPDFVSPEALMPGVPLDGRADLYAVGVMLYNMLTGSIPRGAFRMPSSTLQTDARFDKIIGKAMEMDRENRYQTALDLRRDLDVILTTPAAKSGGQTLPAQQAAPPQKPMGKSPSAPQQRPAAAGKPGSAALAAGKQSAAPAISPAKKSSAGVIYGVAAALVVIAGAAFMFAGGQKKPAASPQTVAEKKPEQSKKPEPKKPEPKRTESRPAPSTPKPAPAPTAVAAGKEKWVDGLAQWFGGTKTHEDFVRENNGGARIGGTARSLQPIPTSAPEFRDQVVRMRWHGADLKADLKLYVRHSKGTSGYGAGVRASKKGGWEVRLTGPKGWSEVLGNRDWPLPSDFKFDAIHTMELRVVGELLTASMDGKKIAEARDSQLTAGLPAFSGHDAVLESFEYANLDPDGSPPVAASSTKPGDVLTFGGHRYQFFKGPFSKDEPSEKAKSLGGHLVTITSAAEQAWIETTFGELIGGPTKKGLCRTAGGKANTDSPFWTNGEPWSYTNWETGSPTQHNSDGFVFLARQGDKCPWRNKYWSMECSTIVEWDDDGTAKPATAASPPPVSTTPTASTAPTNKPASTPAPTPAPPPPPSTPADPRLAQLAAGFKARHEADALQPFNTALTALNTSYVANGVSRARIAAQAKGSLAEVTALDAEKAVIEKGGGVPAEDADGTPESLKTLRNTYRGALSKITAERDAKGAPLLDLYIKALDTYIAELTKAGKIEEAKLVQSLRDAKAMQKPGEESKVVPAPASEPAEVTGPKMTEREVAEWMLSQGTEVSVEGKSGIKDVASLPAGKITLKTGHVSCDKTTNAELGCLSVCRDLSILSFRNQFLDEGVINLEPIRKFTKLKSLTIYPPRDSAGMEIIAGLKSLTQLTLGNTEEAAFEKIAVLKDLESLRFTPLVSPVNIAALETCKKLRTLELTGRPCLVSDVDVSALVAAWPNLEKLVLGENNNSAPITEAALEEIAKLKRLTELVLKETKLSDASLAKLQKALPNCTVKK